MQKQSFKSDFLQEVAKALRVEFGDFFVTETAPMNEVLGEIYREKIKNIAKILDAKGIKVK